MKIQFKQGFDSRNVYERIIAKCNDEYTSLTGEEREKLEARLEDTYSAWLRNLPDELLKTEAKERGVL
jgi:ClpP class serine protease